MTTRRFLLFPLFISGLFLAQGAPGGAAEGEADSRTELKLYIPALIKLLEEKKYAEFLDIAVPPEVMEKMVKKAGKEAFVKQFAEKQAVLLAALKAVKDAKPEMSADGNTATYKIPESAKAGRPEIKFQKIEKKWYIAN